MEPSESEKKLKEIKLSIELPVKLSEVEKEKFTETFNALKGWLDDGLDTVLGMDRDAAYRYVDLLLKGLQKVDVDFVAVVIPESKELDSVKPEKEEPVPVPVVRPTKEQVDGWLDELTPKAKIVASEHLDCIKQYLDPENPAGIDIICPYCSMEKMVQCIRDEDPSFEDAGSIFMKVQTE